MCVAGLSPQVVTETLYALAIRKNPFIPTEIHAITSTEGAHRIRMNLLEADPNEQHFQRLCADLAINPQDIRFDTSTIHQIPAGHEDWPLPGHNSLSMTNRQAAKVGAEITLLEDIRNVADNESAANTITAIVRELTADSEAAIHASIAGGRKTMGFYLGYAMSLFGREQDRLSHVLVSPPFESHPQFYYPPRTPKVLRDKEQRPIHTRDAEITLADIPFVRLRGHLDNSILGESMSYSETVARTQRNVDPPKLILDPAGKTIYCGDHPIDLPPSLFAFYAWFARRLLAGNAGVHWTQDGAGEEYLKEYRRVSNEYSGDYENASVSLKRGMDAQFYEPKVSKTNKQVEKALGKEPARPYLLSNIGMIPGSHYRLKGLTLKQEQARFLGE